jgi:uncharacterized repeat protein (TIGR03803 family)
MNLDGSDYQILHTFPFTPGGTNYFPDSVTPVGNTLYGLTTGFLPSDPNQLFKVNTDGTGFAVLHEFDASFYPNEGIVLSGSTFYGTDRDSGVFKINIDGSGHQVIHDFQGGPLDGFYPDGTVTLVGSTLYGTTRGGGAFDLGILYKMNLDGTGFEILHSFGASPTDGIGPYEEVVIAGSTIYGTTMSGGEFGSGTIFAITVPEPSTWVLFALGTIGALAIRRRNHRITA